MHRALLSLLACLVAGASLTPSAEGTPLPTPFDLYEAGPLDDAVLAHARSDTGPWVVLHQERRDDRTWLLLALPEGRASTDLPGWGRPRYLGRVRTGEGVVYAAPPDERGARLRTGRSVTVTPAGGSILVTREKPHELARRSAHGFRILGRSVPMAQPREAGPPAGLRQALERARSVQPRLRTAAEVEALRDQVRGDSLESYVRMLSETALGNPTGRYYADDATESVYGFYIAEKLENALGSGSVTSHAFRMELPDESDSITVHNIVAKYASPLPNAGAVLVTAHYDATGLRSDPDSLCFYGYRPPSSGCDCGATADDSLCAWNWETDPAPGADDNASGVAAMIETARILGGAGVTFDFDLYFVAFQGEELGLVGSQAFADSLAQTGTPVHFVLNMDMIGHSLVRRKVDLVANENSEWLADYLLDSQQFVPDLPAEKYVEFFGRSDHASFWAIGVDAILLIEDKNVVYPRYHTFQDDWTAISEDRSRAQFELTTQLLVASLARFAVQYDVPDLAIPTSEVLAKPVAGSGFQAGQAIRLTARIFNYGTSYLAVQGDTTRALTARVSFYDGNPAQGGALLGAETRTEMFAQGGFVEFERLWVPPNGSEGFHDIHAVVEGLDPEYDRREISSANNQASVRFFVGGDVARVLEHFSYPNPLRGSFRDLKFCYELTAPADVQINVYNIAGELVGVFVAALPTISEGNETGVNTVPGRQFRDANNGSDLELHSGVYLYSISTLDEQRVRTDAVRGKFAIVD